MTIEEIYTSAKVPHAVAESLYWHSLKLRGWSAAHHADWPRMLDDYAYRTGNTKTNNVRRK